LLLAFGETSASAAPWDRGVYSEAYYRWRATGALLALSSSLDVETRALAARTFVEWPEAKLGLLDGYTKQFTRDHGTLWRENLVKAVDGGSEGGRVVAAKALARLGAGDEHVASQMLRLLTDPDSSVSSEAAEALGELGEVAAVAVPDLLKYATTQQHLMNLEIEATRALGRIGRPAVSAVRPLAESIFTFPDPLNAELHAERVAVALASSADLAAEAIPFFFEKFTSSPEGQRRYPTLALSILGDHVAGFELRLLPLLADSDRYVRIAAACALAHLGEGGQSVATMLTKALGPSKEKVRHTGLGSGPLVSRATVALGRFVERDGYKGVDDDVLMPWGVEPAGAALAVHAILGAGAIGVCEALVEFGSATSAIGDIATAALDADIFTKDCLPYSLDQLGIGRDEVVTIFLAALSDADAYRREKAASALGNYGYPDAAVVKGLEAALRDGTGDVRAAAVVALGALRGVASVAPILSMLRDPNEKVRNGVIEALETWGEKAGAQVA
jgi:HEAT repeat protein